MLVALTLVSAGALLFVAAQTGFVAGPRVLANMAVDSWVPRRFAQLSDRLVTNNGIWLMGLAAIATLCLHARARWPSCVVMYSINVFLTFSLTLLGMVRHWAIHRGTPDWKRNIALHLVGLVLCVVILIVTVYEKFDEGGWLTVIVTTVVRHARLLDPAPLRARARRHAPASTRRSSTSPCVRTARPRRRSRWTSPSP